MTDLHKVPQQSLEALEDLRVWRAKQSMDVTALRAALAQQEEPCPNCASLEAQNAELDRKLAEMEQAEPVQEQVIEDAIEAAYWHFDARKKGLNEWAYAPQSERDAFKAEARKLVRGYFPTRQAQDTKREMLAVADAFIRGKRSAQEQAEPDHETRAEIAEQRVVQLAEERDHYRNLWQKAQQAEPVQEPVATVTECEACFTPDVCQLRGTCDYYTASQMRIATPPRCPNCASLEAQNTELDQKLAELEQAYQSGYNAGVAAERETIIQAMPGGHSVDPQWVCDMIRSRGNT